MRKIDEISNPKSCLNRARAYERIFVLLGHDVATPDTIRFWAERRCTLGKNRPGDPQIAEALDCADRMESEIKDSEEFLRQMWK
jgi:phosphoribosylaminoimidazole-succinocarboxamide synthase